MAEPDFARMEEALGKAAEAGDVAAAQQIAAEMRRMLQRENPEVSLPVDPRIASSRLAAEGMGTGEALLVGAGRTFDRLGAGVEQLGQLTRTLPTGSVPLPPEQVAKGQAGLERLAAEQADKGVTYQAVRRERPFSSAIGEALPFALAVPGSAGVTASGGIVGGGEALMYGTPQERLQRGLLGFGTAAAGTMAGKALGGLISPVRPGAISQTQAQALRSGQNLGIRPRLSEVTGSRFLSRMEDMAARTPGGAGIMDDFARANQQAMNRAAARSIGESSDELAPAVFAQASERLGRVFESVKALPGKPIQITSKVANVADDVLRQQAKMIPQQQDANLISLAQQAKMLAANKGRIDGEAYQLLRSGLSEASFEATGTNKALYGRFLSAIDDAAEESLRAAGQGELATALRSARPQYKNLKMLERGLTAEGGNVSPARLAQTMRTQSPGAFREGRVQGELADLARYGESLKPLRAGSQTYERETTSNLLDLAVRAPWAYGWARATTSPLTTTYPGLLATDPLAALAARRAAMLAEPATRGATMGLLNSYLQ